MLLLYLLYSIFEIAYSIKVSLVFCINSCWRCCISCFNSSVLVVVVIVASSVSSMASMLGNIDPLLFPVLWYWLWFQYPTLDTILFPVLSIHCWMLQGFVAMFSGCSMLFDPSISWSFTLHGDTIWCGERTQCLILHGLWHSFSCSRTNIPLPFDASLL